MEKILANTDARTVNLYLAKGWKVKLMNTPVTWNGSSGIYSSDVSLYVVLENDNPDAMDMEAEANRPSNLWRRNR